MKKTLLEIVQGIVSDMSSDEINDIFDTEESEAVARIVQTTYEALITKNIWPHTRRALTLVARSDERFPTHMEVQENLKELISVFYNSSDANTQRTYFRELQYKEPDDFLRLINKRDDTSTTVETVMDDSGILLFIKNNKAPEYYTSFDDKGVVFDSYDNAVDDTLQVSKFQASGYIVPSFILNNDYVPDLPVDAFPLLVEEATLKAQFKLRQFSDEVSAAEAGRQRRVMSRKNFVVDGGITYPSYGRRPQRTTYHTRITTR